MKKIRLIYTVCDFITQLFTEYRKQELFKNRKKNMSRIKSRALSWISLSQIIRMAKELYI
jgi:hypothetical protein